MKTDLHESNLRGADLRRADLRGADLHDVDLRNVSPRRGSLTDKIVFWLCVAAVVLLMTVGR